ncbi:MAG TPA: ATP-dependent 6-phosphofructokinase [Candidatus Angelobacter sp.]|nr:ATP-dependent 6-phosphofructokinase [Candidatus Angelobacter sp.]
MKIGISTGGGDCPGINAVIRSVVQASIVTHGWRVLGIEDSFAGLIWPQRTRELGLDDVRDLLSRGGTILGTTNRDNPLKYPLATNGVTEVCDLSSRCVRNARELGLDALVVVGGDGTMAIALELFRKGIPLVGVPKTIDNDLAGTEVTFGFDTALHTAADAMDKIHCSAESHHRVMLVELMGRSAGWIALEAGMAAGADVILIPEIPFKLENVCDAVLRRDRAGRNFTIIAVAEGILLPSNLRAQPSSGQSMTRTELLREAIANLTGKETRLTVLGHIQRGGAPSPFDRILCTRFGVAAVDLIAAGKFGRMVSLRQGRVDSVPLQEAVNGARLVDPEGELVHAARAIGICFGD